MNDLVLWVESLEDHERIPLDRNITVGRHLDNDLVIAGEDVRDYHARLELSARGPRIRPLDGANLMVGDVPVDDYRGIMPGDRLVIGHHELMLAAEPPAATFHWALYGPDGLAKFTLGADSLVGRGEECDLAIPEGHVSREHARLITLGDTVWLRDLDSSNGSYVNGERVAGAVRLYHGDELAFDITRYQLIGDHPDLTPIRPNVAGTDAFEIDPELTDEPAPVAEVRPLRADVGASTLPSGDGPQLIGIDGSVSGRAFPLTFGRHLIGRGPEADIHVAEPSVSLRHAEIDVRADGVFVTNLISTNGVQINGDDVHVRRLEPGDRLQLGRAVLLFETPDPSAGTPAPGTSGRTLVLAIAVALLAGALFWWGFT